MPFRVLRADRTAGDRSGEVIELIDADETARAEVWPQWGFNCLRWQVRIDRLSDILHVAPDWESNPVPTRSGHPILFPFPGRLRDGAFTFGGGRFALPLNDSTNRHAIHGFTPRNRWRVTDSSADSHRASVTGEFNLRQDLPGALPLWPADFNLAVTYSLFRNRLRVDARVENLGSESLPFGLGYHPYFRIPGTVDADIGKHVLRVNVEELWESVDLLPTGARLPIPARIDFREPRPIATTELDHVFSVARSDAAPEASLYPLAELSHPESPGRLRILADSNFRNLVLFTPPHRQAVAIEPYTCSADAANLAARGIDSGWQVIPPSSIWSGAVEYHWMSGV
jgi:aldose 1-epimerase